MDKLLPAFLTLALIALIFALMWKAWRRRADDDSHRALPTVPKTFDATQLHTMQYVATTRRDAPLERLALPGLTFRSHGTVALGDEGVLLELRGSDPTFIPRGAISHVDTASLAIDRVVEADGLVRIGWILPGGTACDTYLRIDEPTGQVSLVETLKHTFTTTNTPPERENNE